MARTSGDDTSVSGEEWGGERAVGGLLGRRVVQVAGGADAQDEQTRDARLEKAVAVMKPS